MLFLSYCYKNCKTAKICLKTKQIYATSFLHGDDFRNQKSNQKSKVIKKEKLK